MINHLILNNFKCCEPGSFMCENPVLYPLGRYRLISVDHCLLPELHSLWARGIETAGCCCGHGNGSQFIQVLPEYIDEMTNLGYEKILPVEVDGQLMGENAFKPKTNFEFNGYIDAKSDLERKYEKLLKIVIDSGIKVDF